MKTGTITNNSAMLKKLYTSIFVSFFMIELMYSAASMIDAYYIGNYVGSAGIAASGLARPFFSFVSILGGLFGLGMQLLCSDHIGKGKMELAQDVFSGTLLTASVFSVLMTLFGFFNADSVALLFGRAQATDEVAFLTEEYLRGLFIGAPAMVIFAVLSPIVQLGSGKKIITYSMIVQFITDVVVDALNVFFFNGGMFGFGAATALAYCMALVPLLLYFLRKDAIVKLRLSVLSFSNLQIILRSGWSRALKRICATLKPLLLNRLSLLLGTSLALSAYSVTNQVRDLLISFSAGTAGAAMLLGTLLYGQDDRDGLRILSDIAVKTIWLAAALCGMCILFAKTIAGIFIKDSVEVLNMAAFSIRCIGIMIPFSTMNGLNISFMQITKRFRLVNLLTYLNRLILIVLTTAVLGAIFGINGLWWALPVSEVLNVIISLFFVRNISGTFPRKAVDWLCLSPDFGFREADYMELSVQNTEEITSVLDRVKEFCADHDIDSRRSFFTQLALEELTVNVIEHGFPFCKEKPMIHIWITYEKGDMKIRIQDNCPGFNVMKHFSELQKASRERCIGLRIVSSISKEMNYMNLLNTNNLIITI